MGSGDLLFPDALFKCLQQLIQMAGEDIVEQLDSAASPMQLEQHWQADQTVQTSS